MQKYTFYVFNILFSIYYCSIYWGVDLWAHFLHDKIFPMTSMEHSRHFLSIENSTISRSKFEFLQQIKAWKKKSGLIYIKMSSPTCMNHRKTKRPIGIDRSVHKQLSIPVTLRQCAVFKGSRACGREFYDRVINSRLSLLLPTG